MSRANATRLTGPGVLLCLSLGVLVTACGGKDDGGPGGGGDDTEIPDTGTPDGGTPCPSWYPDADGDGYGDGAAAPVVSCAPVPDHVENALDCGDGDPAVHPDAIEICDRDNVDEDCDGAADDRDPDATGQAVEVWPDADGDGHGDLAAASVLVCDASNGEAESADDCDDTRADAYPGGAELFGDDVDQDCDGEDFWRLADGFELAAPDPAVFAGAVGDFLVDTEDVASGSYAATLMGGGAQLTTVTLDTSACGGLAWTYAGKRGPEQPDAGEVLSVQFDDGAGNWVTVDTWEGNAQVDPAFSLRTATIADPAAHHAALRVRLVRTGGSVGLDAFHVDDFALECVGADGDGDGVGERHDCDPADASHWSDCGVCVDGDGDGHGEGCDLGPDCDDARADVFPGQPDAPDGTDDDCDGVDGPRRLDTFETGALSPTVWDTATATGSWSISSDPVARGAYALQIGGAGAIVTQPLDTSSCAEVAWAWLGKRGPEAPDSVDPVTLEYETAGGWVLADTWVGDGTVDPAFTLRSGVITDPGAAWTALRLRLTWVGTASSDDYYLDDFVFGCPTDLDGDGQLADCDDTDPSHWSDCGLCADADGDGHGAGCDLGADCADGDPTVHPGLPDAAGDGVDADCSGVDGVGFFDDFELGEPSPSVFETVGGDASVVTTEVGAGVYALHLGGGGSVTTLPLDGSTCGGLAWSYLGQRGPDAPEAGEALRLEAWDGATWQLVDAFAGDGTVDAGFQARSGSVDPALLGPGLALRLVAEGTSTDDWYVDDFAVTCGDDTDGDAVIDPLDCAPAHPDHWSDCGACVDVDLDGYGAGCDRGGDCDDAAPDVHPTAPEVAGDGVDADCNTLDGAGIFDDFEAGGASPYTWALVSGSVRAEGVHVGAGDTSLALFGDDGVIESFPLDTSACPSVVWRYLGKRGPEQPDGGDFLRLEYWDGAAWVEADAWEGGAEDPAFLVRSDAILGAGALHPDFRIRFLAEGTAGDFDHWYVDDVLVACGGTDVDGDGFTGALDCAEGEPAHWSDCGSCVDADGDGFGAGCDFGDDCDDADAAIAPGVPDPTDGVDQDCNRIDGAGLADTFKTGAPSASTWATMSGDALVTTDAASSDAHSLVLGGGGGLAETVAFDTSTCGTLIWSYEGKRGPEAPDATDSLTLSWFDGTSWVVADVWTGTGTVDPGFSTRFGVIDDPLAFGPSFAVRLESVGSGAGTDEFYVDDFAAGCSEPDADGDGLPGAFDCDDTDPAHWSDCGLCQDLDGDGAGDGCDLGPDCDDADPSVFPGAPETPLDGIDGDCDLLDGPALFDDFEAGVASATVWSAVGGEAVVGTELPANGAFGLTLGGLGGFAETHPLDTSACPAVMWRYLGKRGPEDPDAGDVLTVEWWDGASWVQADLWEGNGDPDPEHLLRWGTITDPAALAAGFRLRIAADGSAANSDEFHLDDVGVGCATPDLDGDGFPGGLDCDDASADHWADCGWCVDEDGDGYGVDCDRGPDCDDLDPGLYPSAPDPLGDGVDTDCSLADGPGLFDDFESGFLPTVWGFQSAGVTYDTEAYAGAFALSIEGGHAAETVRVDTSICPAVLWTFQGKRGPDAPDVGDFLTVSYDSGGNWVQVDAWEGAGSTDAGHTLRWGLLTHPTARSPGFRLRLEALGVSTDHFHVDDLTIACSIGDLDGDGVPSGIDCDDADRAHWSDCGVCADADGDDFGASCDLGEDCDDADPAVNPDAQDAALDGVDLDCDTLDLTGLEDDFESGATDLATWATIANDVEVIELDGRWTLNLGGGGGEAETVTWDTTVCATIGWAYLGRRGPDQPESTDTLTLEYDTGAGWVAVDTWAGGATDPTWVPRGGTITDPAAFSPAFRMRLTSVGTGTGFDDFYLDDFRLGCVD